MSTISFTLSTQALDFAPLTRGQINIVFNDGSRNILLSEKLTTNPSSSGFFQEVAWTGNDAVDNEQQAQNFVTAFNRDWSWVGGVEFSKNLSAAFDGNVVTITATNGTFVSADYTGNVIVFGSANIDNSVQETPISFSVQMTQSGDCQQITYSLNASGGTAPYTLKGTNGTISSGWDGTALTTILDRGRVETIRLIDSNLQEVSRTFIVPRKLAEGDFDIEIAGFEDGSDIIINRNTVIKNTSPLEYSLDDITQVTGNNYNTTNSFTGIQEGQYKIFIKDVFGCEIFKTITVSNFVDGVSTEASRYFKVMDGQSIIFNEFVDFDAKKKKNYFNTGSYNEAIQGARHRAKQYFSLDDGFIGIQFKSSYPFHAITIHQKDGKMIDIPFVMVSENLGVLEKLDCVRFRLNETQTGVYFNGGNTYIPNTQTVLGSSEFIGTTPSWANIGQLIYLDGTGLRISGNGYDDNYGWYFIVDAETSTEQSATVQLTYSKHPYNTFEFYVDSSKLKSCDVIIIEKGFEAGVFDGNPWVSERLMPIVDNDEYLLIQWNDLKNKADIVFQSGINYLSRYKGEFIPLSDDSSETYSGDSNEYPIEQVRRLNFEVLI